MTLEIEDALYTACCVTTKYQPVFPKITLPNHPRATGTFNRPPSSVTEFKAKLKAFLNELDNTVTVAEILDELK